MDLGRFCRFLRVSWNPLPPSPSSPPSSESEAHRILAQHLASARRMSYYYGHGRGGEGIKVSRYQGIRVSGEGSPANFFFFKKKWANILRLAYTILQNLLQAAPKRKKKLRQGDIFRRLDRLYPDEILHYTRTEHYESLVGSW